MVLRLSWTAVGLLCLLVGAAPVSADEGDGEPVREIWTFDKAGVERTVDVTDMPDFVREAVVKRLGAEGFARRSPTQDAPRGRDLAADARELARHGGRFPAHPQVPVDTPFPRRSEHWQSASSLAFIASCLEAIHRLRPEDPAAAGARRGLRGSLRSLEVLAGRRGTVLGAEVVTGSGPGWRVERVPSGTLAAALGLIPGDRIITADGAPATPDTLVTWRDPIPSRIQRTLGLLRTNGRRESWTLQWNDRLSPDPAPATRR